MDDGMRIGMGMSRGWIKDGYMVVRNNWMRNVDGMVRGKYNKMRMKADEDKMGWHF